MRVLQIGKFLFGVLPSLDVTRDVTAIPALHSIAESGSSQHFTATRFFICIGPGQKLPPGVELIGNHAYKPPHGRALLLADGQPYRAADAQVGGRLHVAKSEPELLRFTTDY